ncbi:MAG: hypothetical protein WBD58_11170 [Geitlerinemataceae cyanobacterium]
MNDSDLPTAEVRASLVIENRLKNSVVFWVLHSFTMQSTRGNPKTAMASPRAEVRVPKTQVFIWQHIPMS